MILSRSIPSLALMIALATLASGCLFGPSIECELSSELTQADCDQAVHAALPKLPNDQNASKLVVRAGCARDKHCLPTVNAFLITVEVTFKNGDRLGVIEIARENWEATDLRYLPAPFTP